MDSVSVLISGAGPTGLTLGLELARRGVPVRIIDKEESFTTASRGKAGIQPRTLEVFYDLGVIDKVLASGTQRLPFRRYRRDRLINETIPYLDNAPTQGEPFRRLHFIPQSRVEEILRERLAEYGVVVELGTELVEFEQTDVDRVTATLATAQGTEQLSAAHLVGSDGGRSLVRKQLGISFEGFTEEEKQLIVGDVQIDGLAPDAWYQWLDLDLGVVMLCPLSGTRSWQIQATPPVDADGRPMEPSVQALQRAVDRATGMPIRVHDATWLSTSRINVRMADRLRVGRAFLAGDAARVHPVLGALGANTGVQDAYNLGWKLALVLAGAAGAAGHLPGGAAAGGALDAGHQRRQHQSRVRGDDRRHRRRRGRSDPGDAAARSGVPGQFAEPRDARRDRHRRTGGRPGPGLGVPGHGRPARAAVRRVPRAALHAAAPDHYASQPHFPTWAYAAVHVTGRPRLLDEVRTMRQLDDLIEDQESRLAPKEPWSLPRRASALFDEYLRLIQGFEIPIGRIDGVYTLGQNKSPADMASQAKAFRERGTDSMDRLADYIERHNNLPRQEPGHGSDQPAQGTG